MDEKMKNQLLEHLRIMIREDKRFARTLRSATEVAEEAKRNRESHSCKLTALTRMLTEYGVEYEAIWNEEINK